MYRCNVKMYIHLPYNTIDRSTRLFFFTLLILVIHTQLTSISLPTFIQQQQQQKHSCHNHYTSLSNIVDISSSSVLIPLKVESVDPFSILCSMLARSCRRSSYIYLYFCVCFYYDDEDDNGLMRWKISKRKICMFSFKIMHCSLFPGPRFPVFQGP